MKIVVFGPDKRTGAVHDGYIVDLSYACAKYLREREGEPGTAANGRGRWCHPISRV